MKSILSFLSISFNEHSLYDLKNPKMDPKYLKRTDFGKIKFYVAKKKKKKEKIDIQIPTTVPTSKRTCQSDCLSSNRKRNGVPAFFSPDACANKVQTINRTAMQMYAVLQVVKKKKVYILAMWDRSTVHDDEAKNLVGLQVRENFFFLFLR